MSTGLRLRYPAVLAIAAISAVFVMVANVGAEEDDQTAERVQATTVPTPSHGKIAAAYADGVRPAFCYFTSRGSFDLTPNGVFQYIWNNHCDVETGLKYLGEDANYYYYQERSPTWYWAFAKNPVNGAHYVWWTGGQANYQVWATNALRVPH